MKTTILENERAVLWYHPETKIVHHEFRAFVYGDALRAVLLRGLELFREHGAVKWLSDDRGNGALGAEDTDWALHTWSPQVIAAGWKFWAVVLPHKVIGQMNMKEWMATYKALGITAHAFSEPEPALTWLEAQS